MLILTLKDMNVVTAIAGSIVAYIAATIADNNSNIDDCPDGTKEL